MDSTYAVPRRGEGGDFVVHKTAPTVYVHLYIIYVSEQCMLNIYFLSE